MSIKIDFHVNHTYLLKNRLVSSGSLISITILLITEKAYHIRWNNSLNSSSSWELIDDIKSDYIFIEDITNHIITYKIPKTYTVQPFEYDLSNFFYTFSPCTTCNGDGIVLDDSSSSGMRICPCCFGSKVKSL